MPMTVVVTRNVTERMRGFLASVMLQIAPGVYSSPKMSRGVRERVESVVADWFLHEREASVMVIWADGSVPEGQGMRVFGAPPYRLVEYYGLILSRFSKEDI